MSLQKSTGPSEPEPYLYSSSRFEFVRIQVINLSLGDIVVPSSLGTSVSDQQRGGQSRGQIDNVVHEREQMGEALKFTQGDMVLKATRRQLLPQSCSGRSQSGRG